MGRRGHGGKRKAKKQKQGVNKGSEHPKIEIKQTTGKLVVDNLYKGKLRSVTVKNIDEEYGLKEMAEAIQYVDGVTYTLHSIERLNRKTVSDTGEVKIVPSKTCKLTFKGDHIPTKLGLWTMSLECKPFWNNVIQCYKCLRYRHLSTTCQGYARCSNCGERKETKHKCTSQTLKCANCKGHHEASSKTCPVYGFNKECNKIMASENVDFKTAVQILNKSVKDKGETDIGDYKIELLNSKEKIEALLRSLHTMSELKTWLNQKF